MSNNDITKPESWNESRDQQRERFRRSNLVQRMEESSMSSNDITKPETWNEWMSVELSKWIAHVKSLPTAEDQNDALYKTVGHLLNRAISAEAQRTGWQRLCDQWRDRFLQTKEGKGLTDAVPPAEGWTAGDRVGVALGSNKKERP